VPLRAGRDFGARDEAGAHPVAIVSEVMARRYWPGGAVGAVVRSRRRGGHHRRVAADARTWRSVRQCAPCSTAPSPRRRATCWPTS
jgi:mRNA-degrading endonuclease toxin of MazEF toxin-antitoxin module